MTMDLKICLPHNITGIISFVLSISCLKPELGGGNTILI